MFKPVKFLFTGLVFLAQVSTVSADEESQDDRHSVSVSKTSSEVEWAIPRAKPAVPKIVKNCVAYDRYGNPYRVGCP